MRQKNGAGAQDTADEADWHKRLKIHVVVPDKPPGVAEALKLLGPEGAASESRHVDGL